MKKIFNRIFIMIANYLMYSASVLYFLCYVPELYANYKNKNVNIYNIPEKVIMLAATLLAFIYAIMNENTELITNYGPLLVFDIVALIMRLHYTYLNNYKPLNITMTTISINQVDPVEVCPTSNIEIKIID